jgi:CheY-like chemotaxis protein
MKGTRPILLVEDDDLDARSVQRALQELHVASSLTRVTNGEEALAWLRDADTRTPFLILLDLNLPVMGGIEFLQAAKADPRLARIPVVVLTASRLAEDRLASFDLSVAGYMVKPVDYTHFVEVVRAIDIYWTLSEMP